jgi:hypothetical protein
MSLYQIAPDAVRETANAILCKYESHKPILDAKVRIDYLFAFPDKDQDGNFQGDAIRNQGVRALGLTRKLGTKDRAAGRGDAEVLIDGEWWEEASEEEKAALLDHELHHIDVRVDEDGHAIRDNLERPALRMRSHDRTMGWFDLIAKRHGAASQEVQQAKHIWDKAGQLYWTEIFKEANA